MHIHCVAYLCAGVVLGWKPGKSSKNRTILATQETLTDFHGDEAKKLVFLEKILRIGGFEKLSIFESSMKISESFLGSKDGSKFLMITLVSSPKQHLRKDMQHSVCALMC